MRATKQSSIAPFASLFQCAPAPTLKQGTAPAHSLCFPSQKKKHCRGGTVPLRTGTHQTPPRAARPGHGTHTCTHTHPTSSRRRGGALAATHQQSVALKAISIFFLGNARNSKMVVWLALACRGTTMRPDKQSRGTRAPPGDSCTNYCARKQGTR